MTAEYIKSKEIIRSVCSKSKLREYIEDCSFEHEHDAEILSMIYLQNKDCGYVADIMGLSYDQTLERHRKAAKRLAALINAQ